MMNLFHANNKYTHFLLLISYIMRLHCDINYCACVMNAVTGWFWRPCWF